MTKFQKIPKQFPTARRSPIPFVIGLGLFVAGIMVYSTFMGGRMSLRYAPLADAAMEIKLEAAMGHLWFEEVISGDRNEDIAMALQHIDQSAWYARAMLEGGENQKGVFIPLRDSVLRIEIEEVLMKIKEFREIAEQRWATAEQSGIGSAIDQRFDAVFEDFLEHADNVETTLRGAMAKGLLRFRIVQGLLIILCLGLSALVVIVIKKYEEDLREHRDHLEFLVGERTKELEASQGKLVEVERLAVLGKLSGGIAHEIRNPLATIDISARNLKRKLKDADEKTISQINRIIKQVKETTDTIQSLQDLTKLEAPNKRRHDIRSIVEDGISASMIPRTVKIVKKVAQEELFADIDEMQISIAIRNVLSNAVQAVENEGTIWISAYREENGNVNISIKDSGSGIPPENLEKIFQSFFGTKSKGFGYGLTICRMIMDKHDGSIDAHSEVNEGATFILSFPSADT